jgi:hypothetical protein
MDETMYRPEPELLPRIAATEMDTLWRGELVWGRVHDENADAAGGVAGHAGLFSTALDLSVFARMMLNGGVAPACAPGAVVGEPCPVARPEPVALLAPEVVASFTARQDPSSSRALGWDTPEGRSSAGDYFTSSAFGHTGYTGTSLWIDPELDLWVVLLTNRVHPTRENQRTCRSAASSTTPSPAPSPIAWSSRGAAGSVMIGFTLLDIVVLIAYLLGVTVWGAWLGRGQKGGRDYFLGSRSLPWFAVMLSVVATETSTLTFLSIPGVSYTEASSSCSSRWDTCWAASWSPACSSRRTTGGSSSRPTRSWRRASAWEPGGSPRPSSW